MGKILLFAFLILFLINTDSEAAGLIEDPDDVSIDISADSTDALTVFSARIKDKTIYLNWRILNIKDINYFKLFRLDPKKKEYKEIEDSRVKKDDYFEKSKSNNNSLLYKYDFEDEPERDGVYFYKLKAYNSNGSELFSSDEIKIGITGIRNFKLEQNNPNPFNPSTVIKYELFEASYVKLKVFDLIGKEIVTLVDANQSPGSYSIEFDASKYANLTSGIYFYKLETSVSSEVKKMILTK
ncbi:MAG TPA: T9SS type A sorting domain-containing protein [Ignavibacteria bacterium]|nr:T9SS type A sorting domain-containing protein [Ignavibacteria bacterium]